VQVGCCAASPRFPEIWGEQGDFFCTASDAESCGPEGKARVQHFWQAFPTTTDREERSVYMFTYLRPDPAMPSLLETFETFWERLSTYQRLENAGSQIDPLEGFDVRRVLFGWFPTYRRNSPLRPCFDRIFSVGDASAVQSPISFGGFCAMLRHLPRLRRGIDLALRSDSLQSEDLARLAPYLPNLGSAWMSSSAMTARAGGSAISSRSSLVNQLLSGNFKVMATLPRQRAITFFRDVTTLDTLCSILVGQTVTMAPLLPLVVAELGALELLEFSGHLAMLALYTALSTVFGPPIHDPRHDGNGQNWREQASYDDFCRECQLSAWQYGSGLDAR